MPRQTTDRLPAMDDTIGGRPARISEGPGEGGQIMEVTVDESGAGVLMATASGDYDRAAVRQILGDCEWTGGSTVADWPGSPLT